MVQPGRSYGRKLLKFACVASLRPDIINSGTVLLKKLRMLNVNGVVQPYVYYSVRYTSKRLRGPIRASV